jgi:ABC-type branched-subunit amino acid transport system ATPase component
MGLSPIASEAVLELLINLKRKSKLTLIVNEQNVSFGSRLADTAAIFEGGKIIKSGSPNEIFDDELIRKSYL